MYKGNTCNSHTFKTILNHCLVLSLFFAVSAPVLAEQPTPIMSCTAISVPGKYILVTDLSASSSCITITASNVELKLDGHTITGPYAGADGASGISAVNVSGLNLKGPGILTNFGRGLSFSGVDTSSVKGITSEGNFFGFVINRYSSNLSENNEFKDNVATGNHQHGFTMNGASHNTLKSNYASNNLADGILLANGTSNVFNDNTATGNSIRDLYDANPYCDNNNWKDNTFYTSNQVCIH